MKLRRGPGGPYRWLLLAAWAAASSSSAQLRDVKPGELALTPAFCQDVQSINGWGNDAGNRSPRAGYWIGLMGETFWAMHHYCWGLIMMHRAGAAGRSAQEREHLRRSAVREYQYVLNHAKRDFPMLPEVYYRIGESYVALNEHPFALLAFAKAREVKADYWPGYSGAAESLLALGRRDEARDMVRAGLAQVPDSPALRRLAERIGERPPAAPATGPR